MAEFFKGAVAFIANPIALGASLVSYFFFVFAGPFGHYDDLSLLGRAGFFLPIFLLTQCLAGVAGFWAATAFSYLYVSIQRVIAAGVFTCIFTPLLHWYLVLFYGEGSFAFSAMGETFTMVGGVCALIVALMCIFDIELAWRETAVLEKVPQDLKPAPRLASRIPDIGNAQIARIMVEDHYVQVFLTDGRQVRLLMRFADAVSELDNIEGYVTHRSHWVARPHIVGIIRSRGRDYLKLRCGRKIPVSRANRPGLLAAGIATLA